MIRNLDLERPTLRKELGRIGKMQWAKSMVWLGQNLGSIHVVVDNRRLKEHDSLRGYNLKLGHVETGR